MLEHGQVATLQHALHEGARRVGRAVVLTLVAHAAHTFYLSVNAVYAWALWPYLELGLYNFHAYRFVECKGSANKPNSKRIRLVFAHPTIYAYLCAQSMGVVRTARRIVTEQ